ncbi:MAG: DsbA family protein [Pseudomonadota bacterium]
MNRLITVAVALVVLVGGVIAWQSTNTNPDTQFVGIAEAQEAGEIDTSIVTEMTLGDPDAPLTVVEYASFTCPHCRDFHEDTFKEFKANYIDTGKVHFIYREVYFDRFGLWAGIVARCGGGDRYFGITDMIYAQQSTWTRGETPVDIADNLKTIGKTAGLTDAELDACLTDNAKAQAMVAVYQENAERDGVRSTPTFLIDGDVVTGNQSYGAFSALIDDALGS